MSQELKNRIVKDDEIDMILLLKTIWEGRKTILKITVVFMMIGLFVAVFSEKEYTASTTFVPQTNETKVGGSLGGLAAMAGISLGGVSGGSEIAPALYPQIINSIPFQRELLDSPLTIEGQAKKISFRAYYRDVYKPSVFANIKKHTIGLPGLLIQFIKGLPVKTTGNSIENTGLLFVSEEESELIKRLTAQFSLEVNEDDGYLTVTARMPEAIASAELAFNAEELLQQYVIDFKIKKSKEQLAFIVERYDEVEKKFKDIQLKIADFDDKNKFTTNAKSKIEAQSMRDEYDLVYGVFNELAKQLEAQYIKVTENTPVFTVLKPVTVPLKKSKPNRISILIIWILLGVFTGVGGVFGNIILQNLKEKWVES
jgi:uncharacterized protein involved in exopolysaccharide biosynthesis